jgi:hypothetical protein
MTEIIAEPFGTEHKERIYPEDGDRRQNAKRSQTQNHVRYARRLGVGE